MATIHMVTLRKDDNEVSVLTSTKMEVGHMFVLFQSSSNVESPVLQILLYQIQQSSETKHMEHAKPDIQTNMWSHITGSPVFHTYIQN